MLITQQIFINTCWRLQCTGFNVQLNYNMCICARVSAVKANVRWSFFTYKVFFFRLPIPRLRRSVFTYKTHVYDVYNLEYVWSSFSDFPSEMTHLHDQWCDSVQTTYAGRKGIFECCSTPLQQSAACNACHRLPQFFQEATEDISV